MQDEKLSAAEETVEPFLQKMHKVIGKESDTQANRNWTFVEELLFPVAKNLLKD